VTERVGDGPGPAGVIVVKLVVLADRSVCEESAGTVVLAGDAGVAGDSFGTDAARRVVGEVDGQVAGVGGRVPGGQPVESVLLSV